MRIKKIVKNIKHLFIESGINRFLSFLGLKEHPKLTSWIYPLSQPLIPDEEKGWKPYHIFKGVSSGLKSLSCHVSVLTKNSCPHPPHAHGEEEILLLLKGEVDLMLSKEENVRRRLKRGEFVYYPAHFPHTLQTVSEEPANYLMFRWHSVIRRSNSCLSFGHFNIFDTCEKENIKEGFCPHLVFEGPTDYLKKLHCHTSTLTPRAGYEPHDDPYDVAIILLEGEIETIGGRMKPYDVVFYAAGEAHGMFNPSQTIAKYIVFEFHGRKLLSYRFARLIKRAVAHIGIKK